MSEARVVLGAWGCDSSNDSRFTDHSTPASCAQSLTRKRSFQEYDKVAYRLSFWLELVPAFLKPLSDSVNFQP